MEQIDITLIDWSRAQFALTAIFHWLFVPLTLGLGVIQAVMETIYVRTGNEFWKRTAQFWMRIFGINFAIGIASGLILEFEFGTNWSNYSWFVGDIFGAPLAIEGILAFFMEATFVAVMFFGWGKVSKGFHLASTWLTIVGATISAYWILVANAWMQYPVGMHFNPDTMRNEMLDFWTVAVSPFAVNKFFHTVLSSWLIGAAFVVGVSCWFLLKKREAEFAAKSIKIAALVGIAGIVLTFWTGHGSAQQVARHQPMKLAAMEGLYEGKQGVPLVGFGIINPAKNVDNDEPAIYAKIAFPKMLSWLATSDVDAFVPGIKDIIDGNEAQGIISVEEKMEDGKIAQNALKTYRETACDEEKDMALAMLRENMGNFGYSYFKDKTEAIPPVGLTFYAFHVMVVLGFYFLLYFVAIWFLNKKGILAKNKWLQIIAVITIPLAYLCSQAGWIVAEVGRQPWAIQDILPVQAAISRLSPASVQLTFFIFLALFAVLLVAELRIMVKAIGKGPEMN